MNQDLPAHLVPMAIKDPQGALDQQDQQAHQVGQASKESAVSRQTARPDLLATKETKAVQGCQVHQALLENQAKRVPQGCQAEVDQVMSTVSS